MSGKETADFFKWAGNVIASVTKAFANDGSIAAAGRQGVDELGMALRAFPESIQAQAPGAIWNSTAGEIADARRPDAEEHKFSLRELARPDYGQAKEKDHGLDHDYDSGREW